MVGTVVSQKPRRLQRLRNESSFARSDAETRPCRETVRDLSEDDSLPVEVAGFYQELRILFFTGSEMRVEAKNTHTNHNGP